MEESSTKGSIVAFGRVMEWVSYPSNLLSDYAKRRIEKYLSKLSMLEGGSHALPIIEFSLHAATSGPTKLLMVTNCVRCKKRVEKELGASLEKHKPGSQHFCSTSCAGKQRQINRKKQFQIIKEARPKLLSKICLHCAKPFAVQNRPIYREKKFCSFKCRGQWVYRNMPHAGVALLNRKQRPKKPKILKGRKGHKNPTWLLDCIRANLLKRRTVYHASLLAALSLNQEQADVRMAVEGKTIFVDIVLPESKVIIEVDGADHAKMDKRQKDKERDAKLLSQGFSVFRVWNWDIAENLAQVVESIRAFTTSKLPRTKTFSPKEF